MHKERLFEQRCGLMEEGEEEEEEKRWQILQGLKRV